MMTSIKTVLAALHQKMVDRWIVIARVVLTFTTALSILLAFNHYAPATFQFLVRVLGLYETQLLIAAGVTLCGVGAYAFKRYSQYWYGFFEVIFAGASVLNIASGLSPDAAFFSRWVALFGAAYIVARGLGNMTEAKQRIASSI